MPITDLDHPNSTPALVAAVHRMERVVASCKDFLPYTYTPPEQLGNRWAGLCVNLYEILVDLDKDREASAPELPPLDYAFQVIRALSESPGDERTDGEQQYARGQFELLADLYPLPGVGMGARREQLINDCWEGA